MHHFYIFKGTLSIVSRYVQMQGSKTIPGVLKVCSPDQQQPGILLQMQILGPPPQLLWKFWRWGPAICVLSNPQVILVRKSENHCAILFYHRSSISDKLVLIQTLTKAYPICRALSRCSFFFQRTYYWLFYYLPFTIF